MATRDIPVANETTSSSSRVTKEGKKITYSLHVIQQPERARACGSGAKSSADRRPVDPPPIVELRIFEGEGANKADITFAYNANFFLFATLENARPIATARGPQPTPSFPVLTGTPVAGMAYLDRPSQAGYFIFPDLSVRHEGKYRLSFALYEELKDARDMDPDDRSGLNAVAQGGIDAHVSHRLEVKSSPFVVFSAKKFPGLSESTALSRAVAEQGCRVRIRRDVRMRRREPKSGNYNEEYDEEAPYDQARRTATPDNYVQQPGIPTSSPALDGIDRPRSVSNASNASLVPHRRPSMEDVSQPFAATNAYSSMPPPQPTGYSQMPQYSSSQHQYQTQYAPPPQPAASLMQPPQVHYPQAHQNQGSYQSNNYGYMNQNYQQSHYEQQSRELKVEYAQPKMEYNQPKMDYPQQNSDYRRPSAAQQYSGPSQLVSPYSPMDQYNRPQMNQQMQPPLQSPSHNPSASNPMHMPTGHSLAPLRTLQQPSQLGKHEPVSPSYQSPPNSLSAPMSATSDAAHNHGYSDSRQGLPTYAPQAQSQSSAGQKRSFSSTFDTTHMDGRMQQGQRPNPAAYGYDGEYDDNDMEEPMDRSAMTYRRADGTKILRRVQELGA